MGAAEGLLAQLARDFWAVERAPADPAAAKAVADSLRLPDTGAGCPSVRAAADLCAMRSVHG